jgi:inward rectifier potassium channel
MSQRGARPGIPEEPSDLGFGAVVARESRDRLLNRDGSFNVRRQGLSFWSSHSLYQSLLTISWPHFLLIVAVTYFVTNILFGLAYLACGPGALAGSSTEMGAFARAFFFSIHTLATIGYGNVSPANFSANILVAVESLMGLLGVAVIAGIAFARFARPTALIVFSDVALIAPYRGATAFEFRIANGRDNQLVELEATVVLARRRAAGQGEREFLPLALERTKVAFFPLSWTVVHPIDENSPLYGCTERGLREAEAEFLVLLAGVDETFAQTVHSRTSYLAEEVVFGARFSDIFDREIGDGILRVDISKISNHQPVTA